MPIILNMYQKSMMNSRVILSATNLDPYIEVSNGFCLFEYHLIGVLLTNNSMPVTDLLVT